MIHSVSLQTFIAYQLLLHKLSHVKSEHNFEWVGSRLLVRDLSIASLPCPLRQYSESILLVTYSYSTLNASDRYLQDIEMFMLNAVQQGVELSHVHKFH